MYNNHTKVPFSYSLHYYTIKSNSYTISVVIYNHWNTNYTKIYFFGPTAWYKGFYYSVLKLYHRRIAGLGPPLLDPLPGTAA